MKKYGYARKRMNVLSFILGVSITLIMWLYSLSFAVVGQINNENIYNYNLREYQKAEKYQEVKTVAEEMIKKRAEEEWNMEKKEGESFEEYFEEQKRKAEIIVY